MKRTHLSTNATSGGTGAAARLEGVFVIASLLACVILVGPARPLPAQDVTVEVAREEPPYYVGEPAVIQFTVEGFDEQPQPTCMIATESGELPAGLRGQLGAANPSVFSQVIQRNGRVFRSTRVTYRIQYLVTADRPGEFSVGPFLIKQGNKAARVEPLPMTFEAVPIDADMRVRLILPDKPVYPDQRVPVTVEWWYAGDPDNLLKLSIYSPLFDEFRFAPDQRPGRRSPQLPVDTKEGRLALAAAVRQEDFDGRTFMVLSAARTLIPDRVGEFSLEPITATVRKATAWARSRSPLDDFDDVFGGSLRDMLDDRRRPARTALLRAVGQTHKLVVKPFPLAGRPESFAGAVGRGFSIDVAAERTVVRVGDPISLNITLRGDGNLDNASLPPLSADGGMTPEQFRLPQGDVPGRLTDDAKHFEVSVRVADESVGEIPSLAYSWFDPETESYQTARSKPIALRVMPAQVVSASDVVSGRESGAPATPDADRTSPAGADGENGQPLAMATREEMTYSLSGADLAIEPEAGELLRDARQSLANSAALPAALYAAGLLLVAAALIDRRRRSLDPAVAARRKTVQQQQARIARAAGLSRRAAAEEVAAALRELIAKVPDVDRAEAQAVIAQCEAITYAPQAGDQARLDTALVDRAKQVAEVEAVVRSRGDAIDETHGSFAASREPRLRWLLLLLALSLAQPGALAAATSQELLEEAVSQYRTALDATDRDERLTSFRRAELLFARLAAGGSEKDSGICNADLYVNLGNAALGAERLGPAIVAYRRALLLDPDHHRAQQNLAHARTLLPDWVPRPQAGGMLDTFFAWSGRLSTGELQLLAAGAFLLAAILLAASILWRQTALRHLALIPAAAWVLLLALLLLGSDSSPNAAVVVVPEVVARAADSVHAPPRLPQPLPSGAEVEIVERRDQWLRVRLADNRDAWLNQSAVELVGEVGAAKGQDRE